MHSLIRGVPEAFHRVRVGGSRFIVSLQACVVVCSGDTKLVRRFLRPAANPTAHQSFKSHISPPGMDKHSRAVNLLLNGVPLNLRAEGTLAAVIAANSPSPDSPGRISGAGAENLLTLGGITIGHWRVSALVGFSRAFKLEWLRMYQTRRHRNCSCRDQLS